MEGVSAGLLIGLGHLGELSDPVILTAAGGYVASDLVYQASREMRNHLKGKPRLGAREQPGTLAVEAGYSIGRIIFGRR